MTYNLNDFKKGKTKQLVTQIFAKGLQMMHADQKGILGDLRLKGKNLLSYFRLHAVKMDHFLPREIEHGLT